MKRFASALLILLTVMTCLLSGCRRNVYPLSVTRIMMDTVITITLYDGDSKALDGAVALCEKYEKLFSKTVEGSDIFKLNRASGATVSVSPDTAELITLSLKIAESSNGAFDPTVLPLVELWGIGSSDTVPPKDDIASALEKVSFENISVNGTDITLKNWCTLDLGGIAKGYIADKVKQYLTDCGVKSAVINLGGNTLLVGNKNGSDFSVGLQKPFGKSGELSAVIMLDGMTAVTSGIYQRYFELQGKIYHHILDTSNGYPVDNGIASVTVIGQSSAIADGLSTACLSLGIEKGSVLASSMGVELIFITADGRLITTDGLYESLENGQPVIRLKS